MIHQMSTAYLTDIMCLIGVRNTQGGWQKGAYLHLSKHVRPTPRPVVTPASLLATDRHGTDARYSASGSLSLDLVNRSNT